MNRLLRACIEKGASNPIVSIHDQGCGGNGNVLKEIVEDRGARYDIRKVLSNDPTLSVCELWGAEYQENNALLLKPEDEAAFRAMAAREKCPMSVVGKVTGDGRVTVEDSADGSTPVDLPLELVLGDLPPKVFYSDRKDTSKVFKALVVPEGETCASALDRVLRLVSVASKRWLVHKVDRSVTGLIAQQQCVGPLQLPLSNVAVLAHSHFTRQGFASSVGECPIKGLVNPAAMSRMCAAEMLTNLVWAKVTSLEDVKCSGNWMWAAKLPHEGARMWDACVALRDALLSLGVGVDGGKDSLSMAAGVGEETVKAPGTLTLTSYVTCPDLTLTVTPDLKRPGHSTLLLLDLDLDSKSRLGGSALAQVYGQIGNESPDLTPQGLEVLAASFECVQSLLADRLVLAGHDRSDGGLVVTLLEMAFSGNCGLDVDVGGAGGGMDEAQEGVSAGMAALFSEEAGMVLEVADENLAAVLGRLTSALGARVVKVLGRTLASPVVTFRSCGAAVVGPASMPELRDAWEATSFALERRQRTPACVDQERDGLKHRTGPTYSMPFHLTQGVLVDPPVGGRHKVAVLRQEGSNGDREMCAAFHAAGLEAWDLTVSDLLAGKADLADFRGLVFVGGFSYADVLDSGKGWAAVVKFNPGLLEQFEAFRGRKDTFSLGVCNGCQFLALLGWVPGADGAGGKLADGHQPRFVHNESGKFESRWSCLKVEAGSPAVLLKGMEGSKLGVWICHGEGRAHFPDPAVFAKVEKEKLAPLKYCDDAGNPTEAYPFNPNGSPNGIASLCSPDGRHLAMMPHPERCFLGWQWPYMPDHLKNSCPGDASPWLYMFQNAKRFCDEN